MAFKSLNETVLHQKNVYLCFKKFLYFFLSKCTTKLTVGNDFQIKCGQIFDMEETI